MLGKEKEKEKEKKKGKEKGKERWSPSTAECSQIKCDDDPIYCKPTRTVVDEESEWL